MNQTELRTAISLAFVYVLRMLGLFMVMPVMAISAKVYPDYSAFLVGLAIGGYGLTQAILQIPMGVLSDKIGRKPVIIGGLLLFAMGSILAAQADSLALVIVGRLLQGAGAIAGAIMALAADLSRESQRPKVMAVIGIAIGFSFYAALLLGPTIAGTFGLDGIFFGTGILAILCILLVIFVVPNAQNVAPKGDTLPALQDIKDLFSDRQLLRLNISVLLLHMLITLLFVQIPGLLVELDWPLSVHWQAYLVVLLGSIIGLMILMAIARQQRQKTIMLVSIAGLTCVLALMAMGLTSIAYLLLVVSLFFSFFNYLEANFPAIVSSLAPAGKKGSAMGIYASFQFFGAFLGGLMAGFLQTYLSPEYIFAFASALCCIWLLIMRGLQQTSRFKRYVLPVNISQHNSHQLSQQLRTLKGVQDITLVATENAVYLKVDNTEFDMHQAREVTQAFQ